MRTILLHIHDDAGQDARLQVAIDIARLAEGHISCIQATGIEPFVCDPFAGLSGLAAIIDTIHDQDKRVRHAIEATLAGARVAWDWRCFEGDAAEALIAQSRLADIVIVSQPGIGRHGDRPLHGMGDLLVHASAPVLVVPPGCSALKADADVMLAWNGSAEAAHAMRLAAPLLIHARCIHVVDVDDDRLPTQRGAPAGDAVAYLARHGITCELHDWPAKGRRVSGALLHAVAELGASYLVMGAYGHSRLRETVLGSVTRDLLSASPVPLLLAH